MCVGQLLDKSPTAEDFTDITELADEGTSSREMEEGDEVISDQHKDDALFQKGVAFAQSQQPGGSGLVAIDTDDYDDEETPDSVDQSVINEDDSQLPDSGYDSLPLSDPNSIDPSPPLLATPQTPPTLSDTSEDGKEGEGGKIESAIPYLIPKDMTIEQLHSKVSLSLSVFLCKPQSLLCGVGKRAVSRFCS